MSNLAKIESGIVAQVIVATSCEWANRTLGGVWIPCENIGIGWRWDGTNFTPPVCEAGD